MVQQAPAAGIVAGATETTPGGEYIVAGRKVNAEGIPIGEAEKK